MRATPPGAGGQPLGEGVLVKRSYDFFSCLRTVALRRRQRVRAIWAPNRPQEAGLRAPIVSTSATGQMAPNLAGRLPPEVHQGRQGRYLLVDFCHGVVRCRQLMATR